jgi:hypothetical protein
MPWTAINRRSHHHAGNAPGTAANESVSAIAEGRKAVRDSYRYLVLTQRSETRQPEIDGEASYSILS